MATTSAERRARVKEVIEQAGGTIAYADLYEQLTEREMREYRRLLAMREVHTYWRVPAVNEREVRVALVPTEDELLDPAATETAQA